MNELLIDYTEKVTILSYLKGKKTYIIAALMIALGLLNGDNEMILQGIAFMTLRAGVSAR